MYSPININLKGKLCIVAGAGPVALRKINNFLSNNAKVIVIADEIKEKKIRKLSEEKKIKLVIKKVTFNDLKKAFLVVLATNNLKLNDVLSKKLNKKNILVNNTTGEGNLIFPAVLNRGNLKIAVSTEGESPFLSKVFRDKLEEIISKDFTDALAVFKKYRKKAIEKILDKNKKNKFFNEVSSLVKVKKNKIKSLKDKIEMIFCKYTK